MLLSRSSDAWSRTGGGKLWPVAHQFLRIVSLFFFKHSHAHALCAPVAPFPLQLCSHLHVAKDTPCSAKPSI